MSDKKHWSVIQERGSVLGMQILLFCYRVIGRRLLGIVLYPVVVYYFFTANEARKASYQFLQRAAAYNSTISLSLRARIGHFYSFALAAFDKIDAWLGKIPPDDIAYTNREIYQELTASSRGAIFIGSHLGNLEVCRAFNSTKYNHPINVLVFTHHAIKFNDILQKANPNVTLNMIQVSDLNPGLMIALREKIDNGESLVIVGDRTSQSVSGRVSYVDFLGKPAPFSHGPFILASLLECPVYLLFCVKQQHTYKVIFEHFRDPLVLPRKTRQQALDLTIADYAQRLAHHAAAHPYQWFNFYDFWRHDDDVLRNTSHTEKPYGNA